MPRMSSAERWHYKFTAAQFRITTPEGQRPTPKELGNATQAAKSFDVVLQGGVHGNYIYTHKKDGQKYFATNAVSAYQSLRDKFKWINYPKAHAKTRERVAARYVILANDPDPVADAAQEMLNLLRRQKKGVVVPPDCARPHRALRGLEAPFAVRRLRDRPPVRGRVPV